MKNDFSISEGSAVAELNRVPGFDPMKYVRMTDSGAVLDLPYKKLWFRLKHPNGITKTTIVRLTEQVAIMEARVFFDRNDSVPAATHTAQVTKSKDNESNFVNLAQNTALDAALSDAGFGVQFVVASKTQTENKNAPAKAETPKAVTEPPKTANFTVAKTVPTASQTGSAATVQKAPAKTVEQSTANAQVVPEASKAVVSGPNVANDVVKKAENDSDGQTNITAQTETVAKADAVVTDTASQTAVPEKKEPVTPTVQAENAVSTVASVTASVANTETAPTETATAPAYTTDTPVEEIIAQMSVEDAENYVVKEGACAGWTMKKVLERRKASIKWYCNGYLGKDNILVAAARILFERLDPEEAK